MDYINKCNTILDWHHDNKTHFDPTIIISIREFITNKKFATNGQKRAIDNILERWHIPYEEVYNTNDRRDDIVKFPYTFNNEGHNHEEYTKIFPSHRYERPESNPTVIDLTNDHHYYPYKECMEKHLDDLEQEHKDYTVETIKAIQKNYLVKLKTEICSCKDSKDKFRCIEDINDLIESLKYVKIILNHKPYRKHTIDYITNENDPPELKAIHEQTLSQCS